MNVILHPRNPALAPHCWHPAEMQVIAGACTAFVSSGEASGWEIGKTEAGDPQLYLIGGPPEHDCIMCVTRLGRLYVLENGEGCILLEHDSVMALADHMRAVLRRRKGAAIARILVALCLLREAIEEKIEPLLAEPMEVMAHFAPQLAALA